MQHIQIIIKNLINLGSKDDSSKESNAENPATEEVFFYDEYDGENDDEEVWLREKREALDEQRDYQYEGHEKAFREDGKVRIISLFSEY